MFPPAGQYPRGIFREVLDSLPQAILILDGGGRIGFRNRAGTSLFEGRLVLSENETVNSLKESLGTLATLHGAVIDPGELPWSRLQRGDTFRDLELCPVEPWGVRRPVLSFSGQTVDEPGSPEPMRVLMIEDATNKYESERLFRTAFERGPVPVTLVRASDERVIDANRALLELLGYERSEVVGRTVPELSMVLNDEKLHNTKEQLARGEDVERVEIVVRGRNGQAYSMLSWHRWVEVGGEQCLLGVYVDITEQKEMERKLHEATQVVLQSASMFSLSVVQQLERLRAPDRSSIVTGEVDMLTRREREVVTRVGAGHSNLRIADELALTPQTIRNYLTRIYRKIGVGNRSEAVVWARERGLVQG